MNTDTSKHRLAFWASKKASYSAVIEALEANGVPPRLHPPMPSKTEALSRACRTVASATSLELRGMAEGVYQFCAQREGSTAWSGDAPVPLFTIGILKDDKGEKLRARAHVSEGTQHEIASTAVKAVVTQAKANLDELEAGAINAWLRNVVTGHAWGTRVNAKNLGAKKRGPAVFWLPPKGLAVFESVVEGLDDWVSPSIFVPNSVEATAELLQALRAEVAELATDCIAAVMKGDESNLRSHHVKARIDKVKALNEKLMHYGSILGASLDELEAPLKDAKAALRGYELSLGESE